MYMMKNLRLSILTLQILNSAVIPIPLNQKNSVIELGLSQMKSCIIVGKYQIEDQLTTINVQNQTLPTIIPTMNPLDNLIFVLGLLKVKKDRPLFKIMNKKEETQMTLSKKSLEKSVLVTWVLWTLLKQSSF
jgi:hypothetical protein